jgi:pyruvate formate lyase activating enzyme
MNVCDRCPRRCSRESYCGFVDPLRGDLYPYRALLITVSPVEALPLYHFYPGSRVLKVFVGGYTYTCEKCPWEPIARRPGVLNLRSMDTRLVLEKAGRTGARLVVFTGAEPLVNDWVYDACRKLRKELLCGFKTSGYIGFHRLEEAARTGDFLVFEIPGAASTEAPMDHILGNAERAGSLDTHLEYVYLDIGGPRSRALLTIVAGRIPGDRPFHVYPVAGYAPSEHDAERMAEMLRGKGLQHYYIHGDPGMRWENTYCPRCGYPVIERAEGKLRRILLEKGNRCPRCGYKLNIIGAGETYDEGRTPWLEEEEIVW